MIFHGEIKLSTSGRSTIDITRNVDEQIRVAGISSGLCNIFIQHTSASLMICENADPDVRRDLETFMRDLVPDGDPRFIHDQEGPDDMPAHVRSVLTQSSITIPIRNERSALGTWQGIYLWEHRTNAHQRSIMITIYGERG